MITIQNQILKNIHANNAGGKKVIGGIKQEEASQKRFAKFV